MINSFPKLKAILILALLAIIPPRIYADSEPVVRVVQDGVRDSVAIKPISLKIDFPINSYKVIPSFGNNRVVLDSLQNLVDDSCSNSDFILSDMHIVGTASPDGPLPFNKKLARQRMNALREYIVSYYDLKEVAISESFVPWREFRDKVMASDLDNKEEIVKIASRGSDDSERDATIRMNALKRLNGGKTWKILKTGILPELRRTSFDATMTQHIPVPVYITIVEQPEPEPECVVVEPEPEPEPEPAPVPLPCGKTWHMSTNAIEWAMAIPNLMGEWDFACHWSLALSAHYSGWNYGKVVRKFRLFLVRPEVRWWLKEGHNGFFVDAHLQFAYYNFALPSWEYRIQDKRARHPAPGGGIGIGYRLPISKNGHWAMEAAVGCGVYHLKYDRFENRKNGPFVDCKQKTWFGIDNAAISIVYNF